MIFESIFGQEQALSLLRRDIKNNKITHAYIFSGPVGIGKKMTAFQFAKAIACRKGGCQECRVCKSFDSNLHPDFKLVERQGNFITIDQIRELEHWAILKANQANRKVAIIDGIEFLTEEAANALLKTLEEPQENVVFINITSNLNAVLPTIISRCRRVIFKAINPDALVAHLLEMGYDAEKSRLAVNLSQGIYGKALELMDSSTLFELRAQVLDCLRNSQNAGPEKIGSLVEAFLAIPKKYKSKEEKIDNNINADFGLSLTKKMKEKMKRVESARGQELLLQSIDFWWFWLRDIVVFKETADKESIINIDLFDEIDECCQNSEMQNSWYIVERIPQIKELIKKNINPQLALETLLLQASAAIA